VLVMVVMLVQLLVTVLVVAVAVAAAAAAVASRRHVLWHGCEWLCRDGPGSGAVR
jgi:hypothetical protein